jgi:hypothetical protein
MDELMAVVALLLIQLKYLGNFFSNMINIERGLMIAIHLRIIRHSQGDRRRPVVLFASPCQSIHKQLAH